MTVYLIGAGPGSISLLTVRAKELIQQADCALVDALASDDIISLINPKADIVDVGKTATKHKYSQDEINELMFKKSKEYECVVRIKGGDPFIFGRGGEEQYYLTSRGVKCEVVPGISSSFAAPAYAGIPVTHRDVAPLFTIVTGHEQNENDEVDWLSLGKSNSPLIILMGVKNRGNIAKKLMQGGRSPLEPVAVITNATRENQQVKISYLEELAELEIVSPSVIIVGEIVEKQVPWFEPKQLSGCKLVVARPTGKTSLLGEMFRDAGASVLEVSPTSCETIEKPLPEINQDSLLFTSSQGVKSFLENLKREGKDWRFLYGKKVFAIGQATAKYLVEHGCNVDAVAKESSSIGCVRMIKEQDVSSVLLIRPKNSREVIASELKVSGIDVEEYVIYETIPKEIDEIFIDRIKKANFIVVAAGSTIKALSKIGKFSCITIGQETTKIAREYGWNVIGQSDHTSIESLYRTVLEVWGK